MKQLILLLIVMFGLLSCKQRTDENKGIEGTVASSVSTIEQIDTLASMPIDEMRKEISKGSLVTFWERSSREFPFDSWLTKIKSKDSILEFTSRIDSIKRTTKHKASDTCSFDFSEKWILSHYFVNGSYGIPQLQMDVKEDYYLSKMNKYVLNGDDIFSIFKINKSFSPLHYFPELSSKYISIICIFATW